MSAATDFLKAVEAILKLQEGFDSIADVIGAKKAFYYFAGEVVKSGYALDTEERFVRLIRAAYDAYVADKGPS